MTKYQLVFAKLEVSLSKVSNILKRRNQLIKLSAFKDIEEIAYVRNERQNLQSKLLFRIMESKVNTITGILSKVARRNLSESFTKIERVNHLKRHEAQIVADHERFKKEFVVTLNKKDSELAAAKRKNDENAAILFALRNREIETLALVKAKEATILSIQRAISDASSSANTTGFGSSNQATATTTGNAHNQQQKLTPQQTAQVKQLEAKIAAAEQEQQELKEKQLAFSSNVSMFVRDINEVMDGFEGSTMLIASDENVSLDEHSRSLHGHLHQNQQQQQQQYQQNAIQPNHIEVAEDVLPMYALTNKKASHPTAPYLQQSSLKSPVQTQQQQQQQYSQQQQQQQQFYQQQQQAQNQSIKQQIFTASAIQQQQQQQHQQQQQQQQARKQQIY